MKTTLAWIALLMVGIVLIISSIEGNLGSIIGAFLTPASLGDVS